MVFDRCPIHGPRGAESLQIAHLKRKHLETKARSQEQLKEMSDVIAEATSGPNVDPWVTTAISRGVMAGIRFYEVILHRNMVSSPEDTHERRECIRKYGIDPEEERD